MIDMFLYTQVLCTTSSDNGLCIGTIPVPMQWFSHNQPSASLSVVTRFFTSFNPPVTIGSVTVRPQPILSLLNDIAIVTPGRPVEVSELFEVPVYAHATYSVATFGVRCEVSQQLVVEGMNIDSNTWIAEVRPLNYQQGLPEIGIAAVLRNPESVSEGVVTQAQLIFSLQVRVLRSALEGSIANINCTTAYLSNIYNEKIQPRGLVTPVTSLAVDSNPNNDQTIGDVQIAQTVPRGLFSFADQAQIVNTAVFSLVPLEVQLTHLVAMSSGAVVPVSSVTCQTASSAFYVSDICDHIFVNGSETDGAESDVVVAQYQDFAFSVPLRVWFPTSDMIIESRPSTLYAIQGWISPNETGQCVQQFQQAELSAFASFAYSPSSPMFTVSILPHIVHLLVPSDPDVIAISGNGTVFGLMPGSSLITAPSSLISPVNVTVVGEPVQVTSLDITLFSGLILNVPASPYPLLSAQLASVGVERSFTSVGTQVFSTVLALTSDGGVFSVRSEFGLKLQTVDSTVLEVDNETISLVGRGSGEFVEVSWLSPCTGEVLAISTGHIDAVIPDPTSLTVDLSSSRITYPGDTASSSGIPVSATFSITVHFPDGLTRDATSNGRTQYNITQGDNLVSFTVMESEVLVVPIDVTESAIGEVVIMVVFDNLLLANISLAVVRYQGVQMVSIPFPPYPGSASISKTTLFSFENTNQFQRVALDLEALLTDGSTISVTQSPFTFFQSLSPGLVLNGNIVQASSVGNYQVQGQFGPDSTTLTIAVSSNPVSITSFLNISLQIDGNTLSGIAGLQSAPVVIDAEFNDSTVYPRFVPDAVDLFPSLVTLTTDAQGTVSVDQSTASVTLLANNHLLVTITAVSRSDSSVRTEVTFACNLQPAIGDIDIGFDSGVPLPSSQIGDSFSVPISVNAGTQSLASIELDVYYDSNILSLSSLIHNPSLPGNFLSARSPRPGVVMITGNSLTGTSGLIQLAALEFSSISSGVASISGRILQILDTDGNPIGSGLTRDFVAGDVSVEITSSRRRREAELQQVRVRRNVQCPSPPPCGTCPSARELGDINGDCVFDIDDPSFLLQYHAENLFGFQLNSGMALLASLIMVQEEQLDVDMNTALDLQDVYFLLQTNSGLLNFVTDVTVFPVEQNPACVLSINTTLQGRGNVSPDAQRTEVYFDIALPFDPTFSGQQLFDESVVVMGTASPAISKGLTLQGGVLRAAHIESGVFGVEILTNLTVNDIGLSVIQVTSSDGQITHQARTRAFFGHPDPPYTYSNQLDVNIPAFADSVTVLESNGYTPFIMFNNTLASGVCLIPPGPPILNQSQYSVDIPENIPLGSTVLVFTAVSQSELQPVYTVSLGNDDNVFSLDPDTGILIVINFLDYETLASYQLQLVATDPATTFSSVAIADIFVTDFNDNSPVFISFEANITLPSNTPVGSLVTTVTANDSDSGLNAVVEYGIQSDGDTFAIDPTLGVVTLQRQLDFNVQSFYIVTVNATDVGVPRLTSFITLNISVDPPDPTLLQFEESVYLVNVEENIRNGSVLVQLRAFPVSNNTGSNASMLPVEYILISPRDVPFVIDSDTGELVVFSEIDREIRSSYNLLVSATLANASHTIPAMAVVLVTVLDVNDNPPVFSQDEYTNILLEEMPPGTLSLSIIASDPDLGLNGSIQYSLLEGSFLLSIDNTTGRLTNADVIDFEMNSFIMAVVIASDMGTPVLSSTANVTITIADINDNPPVLSIFPDNASLSEGDPIGTFVARASAFDLDSPSTNGVLLFSLDSVAYPFRINSSTGEILTSSSLDYETISSYEVIVVIQDSGNPPLSSTASLNVFITDDNDNPPLFSQDEYLVSVGEEIAVGTTLLQLNATDEDSGSNAEVNFTLLDNSLIFGVTLQGAVILAAPLDFELVCMYMLNVSVANLVPGTLADFASIIVEVADFNEFPPVFSVNVYNATVAEESQNVFVVQVSATDLDGTANVTYTLNDSSFTIDVDGNVFAAQSLDREMTSQFELTVLASDNSSPEMSSSAVVVVTVLDINDNSPEIGPFQNLTISEATSIGTSLLTFTATDNDVGSNGEIVRFSLLNSSQDFNLTANGELSVANQLSSDTTSQYFLTIEVEDGGTPPLSTTAAVIINVQPSAAPLFEQQLYSVSVEENGLPNINLVQVRAVSRNPMTVISQYLLSPALNSSLGNIFAVEPDSGNVTALISFDREVIDRYVFTIEVEAEFNSTILSATTTVIVAVSDQNDNPPVFLLGMQSISIPESTAPGSIIARFEATDRDVINNVVVYSITGGNNDSLFAIDQNGNISTLQSLFTRVDNYSLTIQAFNPPDTMGTLSSTAQLQITIEPVNSFSPEFDMGEYFVDVNENTTVGSVLITLAANDSDIGTAGQIVYRITDGNDNDTFSIHATSGVLTLESSLDYELRANYDLTITASDWGSPVRSAEINVTILVLDDNDNPPVFTERLYNGTIQENQPPGQSILMVSVTDADSPTNSVVSFEIDSNATFEIMPTGVIRNLVSLNREIQASYIIMITAINEGSGVILTANTVVQIDVTDVNDNTPQFSEPEYRRTLQAPVPVNMTVVQVQASDMDDVGPNSQVRFSIDDTNGTFTIDTLSGIVSVATEIRFEDNFTIIVTASDLGTPSLSNQSLIQVSVLPADDLSAGRERDVRFTTDVGVHLINTPREVVVDTYQQQYGFVVGRDVREMRTITASLGPLSDTLNISPLALPAANVKAVLISSEVWHDSPQVLVAVQVRDQANNVHLQHSVLAIVTHPVLGIVQASCLTRSFDGTCIISVSIPDTWFSNQVAVTVEYGLSMASLQALGAVSVQSRPTFSTGNNIYVFMEMPLRNLFRNDLFTVSVFAEAGTKAVGSYTVTVSVSSDIILVRLNVDSTVWQAQTLAGSGGSQTITAVRADQSVTPQAERILLFNITAQVSSLSPVDTLMLDAVTSDVVDFGDFDRMRLLPSPGVQSVPSQALSRNGITTSGAVFVADDVTVGLLPYVNHAELLNTAPLNGVTVSTPINILEVHLSGIIVTAAVGLASACNSSDADVITTPPDCSSVLLTSAQSQPSSETTIFITHDGQSSSFPVSVWTPVMPVRLVTTNTVLNSIPALNPNTNCSTIYQMSSFVAFAEFTNSRDVVQNIDVTTLVSSQFSSSDSSILIISGNQVSSVSLGITQVTVSPSNSFLSILPIEFNVTDEPVELLGLDVQVLTGLDASGTQDVGRLSVTPLTVSTEQVFDFEGDQGVVITTAVFADGSRIVLNEQDLNFTSLNPNVVKVTGSTVTAVGTGQGEFVEVTWNPASVCFTEPIATGLGTVSVNIPQPQNIVLSVQSPILAPPSSNAELIGVPTVTSIQVIASYASGRVQDLTNDGRTIYSTPQGITISNGQLSILSSVQVGSYQIQVSFSQFPGLERNMSITVVEMEDIVLSATPFPTYPGSSSNIITNLNVIATTNTRQQALLAIDAVLSNGDRRDISSFPQLQFMVTGSRPELEVISSISPQNVLSFSDAAFSGFVTIFFSLRTVISRNPLMLTISARAVQVSNILVSPFPEGNTFRGIVDVATRQVVFSATFDDGTQYINLFQDTMLSNLVRFDASPSTALTIDSASGVATLRGNSHLTASISVSSLGSPPISRALSVLCNLDPDVGDVDLGLRTGVAVPSQQVGSTIVVPIRVNSGSSVLDSIELDVTFEPTIFRVLSATRGSDWPSTGQFVSSINDPVNIVTLGGTLVGSSPVTGNVHLANIEFEVVGSGLSNMSGVVHTLAEQSQTGAPATNIGSVPREFIAGAIQIQSSGSRKRRLADPNVDESSTRFRRQSSCSSPPCASCAPFRETGDVDGNCIFDVRDASFLQLYYLQTITTGVAPSIPADREMYLDIDLNGIVDPNDVIFMLRVNFRLLRFLVMPTFVPVEDSTDNSCTMSINMTLLSRQDIPADNASTSLVIDFAHEDISFQQMFDDTNFTVGTLLLNNKGSGLYGGLVEATYLGDGVYGIVAESAITSSPFGLSPVQITFDAPGSTSAIRTAAMFSQTAPRYDNLDLSFPLRGETIRVSTQGGYSPLISAQSSLTTPVCVLQRSPLNFENQTYSDTVIENTNVGAFVLQVRAISNRPVPVITYTIINTVPFAVNPTTGDVTLRAVLDFENDPRSYSFSVRALETVGVNSFTASTQITITLENINDLEPVVSPLGVVQVLANQAVGVDVARVVGSDPDILDVLQYSIESSTTPGLFTIGQDTGVLTIASSLFGNANTLAELNVSVSDSLFTAYTSVSIDIYLPNFTQQSYSAVISELAPMGSFVLSLEIENVRTEEFVFESQSPMFGVNVSGAVFVQGQLDHETQSSFMFTVTANSTNILLQTDVSITLSNVNEHAPVFSQALYNLTYPSSTPIGTLIVQVSANDSDSAGPSSNIAYSLVLNSFSTLFTINSSTGELFLAQTLLGQRSLIELNISATDAGVPSLSGFTSVVLEITLPSLSSFPIPPTVRATDSGFVVQVPQRSSQTSSFITFQQDYGKFSSPLASQLTASYPETSVSASVDISTELQPATNATVFLLHPTNVVYEDGPELSLAFQVRDVHHRVTTMSSTTVEFQATLVGSTTITSSSCSPDTQGVCVISLSLPSNWFGQPGGVVLVPLLNGVAAGIDTPMFVLNLQPSIVSNPAFTNHIIVEVPSRDIVAGETFDIDVFGNSTYPISGFSLTFQLDPVLIAHSIVIDHTQWSVESVNATNSFGVTAILTTPVNQVTPGSNSRTSLFSLQLIARSTISTAFTATISAQVQSLSNVVEGSVILGSSSSTSGPAQFVDRSGFSTSGSAFIVPNVVVGLFPTIQQTEILNTAVLDGVLVSIPVNLFAVYTSGQVLPVSGSSSLTCSSSQTSIISIDQTCRLLFLLGSETSGGDIIQITFNMGTASGVLPLRVYFPIVPARYNIPDMILNRIHYSVSSTCQAYQNTTISVTTNFTAGVRTLADVSVTDIVMPTLTSNDTTVVAITSGIIMGLRDGGARLCPVVMNVGCVEIAVVDQTVSVASVIGSLLAGLNLNANFSLTPGNVATVEIELRSQLQFEQERGTLVIAVMYSDGSVLSVNPSDVVLQPSLNSSIYAIQKDEIVALGSGETEGEYVWSPQNGQCGLQVMESYTVSIALPSPTGIRTSLLPSPQLHSITTSGSSASLVGIPTTLALRVSLEYQNGRTLDVTSDPRVSYTPSINLISVASNGDIAVTGLGSGMLQLTITFSMGGVSLSTLLLIEVVQTNGLRLQALPYPPYPGSDMNILTALNPIEDTQVWQKAALRLQLLLSNNSTVDVTIFSQTTLTTRSAGSTSHQISSGNVLSVSGNGLVIVEASFGPEPQTSIPLQINFQPVRATSVSVDPLPQGTLQGVTGTYTTQLTIDITFSDGTQFINFPLNPLFTDVYPGLVSYTTSSQAFNVSEQGLLQPLQNSILQEEVQVNVGTNSITASTGFVVNLEPDVGDIDLGVQTGEPISVSAVGGEFVVPVLVNTGGRTLGSIDIELLYDVLILQPLSIDVGPDWGSGIYESSLNDPPGVIRLGGAQSSNGIAGTRLHIFSVRLRVLSFPPSSETFLRGNVVTFAEGNIVGTPIGQSTPRPIIAGSVTLMITSMKRSAHQLKASLPSSHHQLTRSRRQAVQCLVPPCACSGQALGDTDGNCVFDITDIYYSLVFITESSLGFSQPRGQDILNRTTPEQLRQLDPNQDGIVDTSDAYFLLRALFRLVYFLENVRITPVQDLTSGCLFTVEVQLRDGENSTVGETEVFIDIAFTDPSFQVGFDTSSVERGSLVTSNKGSQLYGGIISAERSSQEVFVVQLRANFVSTNIGISVITATFDAQNNTSTSRTIQFFGPPPPLYTSPLNLALTTRNTSILVGTSAGYSPFLTTSNIIQSADCSDVPLLAPQLSVNFTSPFQAVLEWNLLNMRMGLDFTASLQISVTNCSVSQSGVTDNTTCSTYTISAVDSNTTHVLTTIPFVDYTFQVQGPTTSTNPVQARSPEAPPDGVQTPTFAHAPGQVQFTWRLPSSPNGIIIRYTLYLGLEVVYNSTQMLFTLIRNISQPANYTLEAHNLAGSAISNVGLLSVSPFLVGGLRPGISVGITDAIIVCVVLTVVVLLVLLSILAAGMCRHRWGAKKKIPEFLSRDFSVENTAVVSW